MTKAEMIDTLFTEMNSTGSLLTKKDVHALVTHLSVIVQKELKAGRSFALPHVGTFNVRHAAAKKGRNPRTGEPLDIPARKRLGFKAGTEMKRALNG